MTTPSDPLAPITPQTGKYQYVLTLRSSYRGGVCYTCKSGTCDVPEGTTRNEAYLDLLQQAQSELGVEHTSPVVVFWSLEPNELD